MHRTQIRRSTVRWLLGAAALAAIATVSVSLSSSQTAEANDIAPYQTVYHTNFVSAGYGGMRGIGTGTISLSGVSGTVTQALLFWHGPTNSTDSAANASVTFNGTAITGTNIGFSSDNCWGFTNSQAYRADVTSLVTGNGDYSLANFTKADAEVNGVSLIVFFDNGNPADDRDVVIFDGNDSDTNNTYDAAGWNVSLPDINYTSGTASMQLHVSDGQTFTDGALVVNGTTVAPTGPIWEGDSVPNGPGLHNGGLWDIKSWDVTSFLSPGPNTLTITSTHASDCLSLIVAMIDLPAGAAPNQPSPTAVVTTPTVEATPCIGGIVNSRCPKNPPAVRVTPTPEPTQTEAPAPSATVAPPTAAPPQPTATLPGGGAAGVITGPNTGSGPDGAQMHLGWLLLAAAVLAGGAGLSVVARRLRPR